MYDHDVLHPEEMPLLRISISYFGRRVNRDLRSRGMPVLYDLQSSGSGEGLPLR